ncbi:MAG: N-acetylmuramoyl-L-alanine amidase [Timaviella obliquedivisa GSE-PSE-MK23-08B]|jgi:N-acetylmuramoyl-L-alanine amidase|nr:N-acetylmuramoyl-L-alanine amidase [Timaviella obliquedivisa GSE-PSE-MK23-08B]
MKNLSLLGLAGVVAGTVSITSIALAEQPLFVAYPADGYETNATQIFLIGTAPAAGEVTINGQRVERSDAGHFAPTLPLQLGENVFDLRYGSQRLKLRVIRASSAPPTPTGATFAAGSLIPAVDVARLPGEPICFGAIAPPNAKVTVTLGSQTIPLLPQINSVELPPNSAVLTQQEQPMPSAESYQGCTSNGLSADRLSSNTNPTGTMPITSLTHDLGYPQFQLILNGQTQTQTGTGKVKILSPVNAQVIEVTADPGTARTGASTDYSRLTPLPKGTTAAVTGREGEWLRLDYGGWIKASETRVLPSAVPPRSLIRSIRARQVEDWTEVLFPLQVAVPVTVQQGDRSFALTLHNTTAQTDTIRLDDDPLIERLDWQQTAPQQIQYTFSLKSSQQWGYKLRYEGTTLVLSLKHPPQVEQSLKGISILLDPGHGGAEDLGARGPTGYPEKDVVLIVSKLLRDRLLAKGATVYMTREADIDLGPNERAAMINQMQPDLAVSLHYNALPDEGDAAHTSGIGAFWYNAQSHGLAVFLHNYLVEKLDRPSYGVFWNNLALTRPTVAPAILLELGFMINPQEFEWITDEEAQEELADSLSNGIEQWIREQ